MSLQDFFDLFQDSGSARSKADAVSRELSEVELFREDTQMKARARDERRVDKNIGFASSDGVLDVGQGSETRYQPQMKADPADIVRSRSNGRFAVEPVDTPETNVDRRRSSGRFVSTPQEETGIGRDRETGRFTGGGF